MKQPLAIIDTNVVVSDQFFSRSEKN